jgi:hypothetical protein
MTRAFKAALLVTLLFSLESVTIPVQAADDDDASYGLRSVTSVRYGLWGPEVMFGDPENDCKIDRAAWQTAMDSVAKQSNVLKLISEQVEFNQVRKDLKDGKCQMDLHARDHHLPFCGLDRQSMPDLRFSLTVAKTGNTCLGQVKAKVSDGVVGQLKFRSTARDAVVTVADMWSSSYWVKNNERYFTQSVIETSAIMMKEFLDEWTRVACSDCYITGEGGTPPNWVAKAGAWDVVVKDFTDLLRGRNTVARLRQRGLVLLADDVRT